MDLPYELPSSLFLPAPWTLLATRPADPLGARKMGVAREYVGCVFGTLMDTARGQPMVGDETKMARMGQRYNADGRGSEVGAVASCFSAAGLWEKGN